VARAPAKKKPSAKKRSNRPHMDLDDFVNAQGRAAKVKDVRKMIDKMGIEYLYLQFVSVTGKIMGKGIPADHWETVAEKGFQLSTVRR